jgi:nitrite reductase/ring-hydroxylating ferredoxin subunit
MTFAKKNFQEGSSKTFEFKVRGQRFKGFIVKKNNQYFAYQNLCQHLPITLDLNDNKFFTHDRQHLQCHMHGAIYEIDSGLCISGPCEGARLVALTVREEENEVVIEIPKKI